jgi:transcriptional regulator with XRE-family HTH domain
LAAVADQDPIQILVGRALRSVRLQRGMTQERLAAACGMHPTYVSDIERGARNPSWKAIVRLARGLEVPVATIAAAFDELAP